MIIEQDGNYQLQDSMGNAGGEWSAVYASGNFNGAIVILAYADEDGAIVPLIDGALVSGEQYRVDRGMDVPLLAQVSGTGGAARILLRVA